MRPQSKDKKSNFEDIFNLAKYDYTYKKKVIEAYKNEAGDYQRLANHFDIASISIIRK